MDRHRGVVRWTVRACALVAWALAALGTAVGPALAHGGSLGRAARDSLSVPAWLIVATGGAAVGASFLLASFGTDRAFVAGLHGPRRYLRLPGRRWLSRLAGGLGVAVLAVVVVAGFLGSTDPLSNGAIVIVWVGWWAGFTMSTYLVGNAWPALNPFRAVARALPSPDRRYRWRWGAWPAAAGLLALVWLEVVGPLAEEPRTLAVTVLAYGVVTVAGALVYGPDQWFGTVDPVSRVFRMYGRVAPLESTGDGLALRFPGGGLTADVLDGRDDAAFVVTLLWATTYDGLVTTPLWRKVARVVVNAGVPPVAVYPAALVAGAGVFWGLYLLAARLARRTAPTYVDVATLVRRFAPPLLAVAAGYHLAHFLGYFVALLPPLALAVTTPLATVEPAVVVLPGWFGTVAVAGVLVGHVLAVLAAHATAFEVFPGRMQAIRSQYPFVAVMVLYTVVSLWIVTRPEVAPPYL
jgi:hypothetical protein